MDDRVYRQVGFTLIELLVTIMVLAVIAAAGAPAWRGLIESNRVNSDIRSVKQALSYARSEAVTTGDIVSVCSMALDNDGNRNGCGGKEDWKNGWIVFSGDTFDAAAVLRVGDTMKADTVTAARAKSVFSQRGEASGTNQTWKICAGSAGKKLVLSNKGRVRQEGSDCS
jgi:type IV fimbrial biogenesis protein FimT